MALATMKGTTGSDFKVIAETQAGRIGYRALGNSNFRIRVEPAGSVKLPLGSDWEQPTSKQKRYSKVVTTEQELNVTLTVATTFLVLASV